MDGTSGNISIVQSGIQVGINNIKAILTMFPKKNFSTVTYLPQK